MISKWFTNIQWAREVREEGGQPVRTGVAIAAGGGRISVGGDSVSAGGGWQGPREGESQLVLGALVARVSRDGGGGSVTDRDQA